MECHFCECQNLLTTLSVNRQEAYLLFVSITWTHTETTVTVFCNLMSENPSEVHYVNNEILKNRNLQNHPLTPDINPKCG